MVYNDYRAYSQAMAVQPSQVDAAPDLPAPGRLERFEVERCTISQWRGYVSATFVALTKDGTPVAESTEFRCRGKAAPAADGAALRAYDELRAELVRLGWEEADARREIWYAGEFTRLVESEVASVPTPAAPAMKASAVIEPARRPLHEAPSAPATPQRATPRLENEARPFKETPLLPAAGHTPVVVPRQSRLLTVVTVLGIVLALAVGAYLIFGQGTRKLVHARAVPVAAAKPKQNAPAIAAPATPVPAQPAATANVRVTIRVNSRSSWLEVRRGSATGAVLFTGELAPGRTLHLAGKRLWARFGAAGNLTITANGRPVRLVGTYEHVFVAKR
jgi:hypothetical protein